MSHLAKKQYLIAIWDRYQKASKAEKSRILSEFCAVCKYNRKYATRLLNLPITPCLTQKRGVKPFYTESVIIALKDIWLLTGSICAKRLKGALPEWLEFYLKRPNSLSSNEIRLLQKISISTIDRKLKKFREQNKKGKSTTRKSNWAFRAHIPIQTNNDGIDKPGFVQADTVAHCGTSIAGEYAHTVTATDLFTTWTETRAIWRKQSIGVQEALDSFEKSFPFSIFCLKTDSGSEFLNDRVYSFLVCREFPIHLVRSRPYKKNDQCYVEQKNFQHARTVFKYIRLDHPDLVEKMNEIYIKFWNPLQNFFIPTMKLKSKTRNGSKFIKTYWKPKTPFQRVMESKDVTDEQKIHLQMQKKQLNPIELRIQLEIKLKEFFDLTKLLVTTEQVKFAA